jgi:uncharacterized lipoprotein YmbA
MLGGELQNPGAPLKTAVAGVLLRKVDLPSYLNRDELVLRKAGGVEYAVAEYHLWVEPLSRALSRLLEETMRPAIQERGLDLLWPDAEEDAALRVEAAVLRFDASPGHRAWLRARWRILDGKGRLLLEGLFDRESDAGSGYDGTARALGLLAGDFGRDLARAVLDAHAAGLPDEKARRKQGGLSRRASVSDFDKKP